MHDLHKHAALILGRALRVALDLALGRPEHLDHTNV